ARAEATLWRFALSADLFPTVTHWNAPPDDSLPWLVADTRRIKRRRTDNLWLRIEDIPTALAARHYPADGTLRFSVDSGCWALTVQDGRGVCVASNDQPALRLDRAGLGALFLGDMPASWLARAAVIEGEPTAVALADRLFRSDVAPWCPEIF
ncbi:MAG: sterol carrier protein domain-containing protein, partial [Kofleriaceae bacterium]